MRRYVVNGGYPSPDSIESYASTPFVEFDTPQAFEDFVFSRLQERKPLKLNVTEVQDELAHKRSPAVAQDFTFRIRALHTDNFFIEVTDEAKHYIRIDAQPQVAFTIFD